MVVSGGYFCRCGFLSWVFWFFSGSPCTTAYKMWWMVWPSVSQPEGRTHQRMIQQQPKPNYNWEPTKKAWRASQEYPAQDIKETASLSPTDLLPQKVTPWRLLSKQINMICRNKWDKPPKMGRWRNNPQSKTKKEPPERELNEIEASKLSDIEFKVLVIRMLKELRENYKELQGNYKELTWN